MCQKCQLPELKFDLTKLTCNGCGSCYAPSINKESKLYKYIAKLKTKYCSKKCKGIEVYGTYYDPTIEKQIIQLKVDKETQWITDVSDDAVEKRKNELCNHAVAKLLNSEDY